MRIFIILLVLICSTTVMAEEYMDFDAGCLKYFTGKELIWDSTNLLSPKNQFEISTFDQDSYQVKLKTRAQIWDLAIHYSEIDQERTDIDDAVIPVKWRLLSAGVNANIGKIGVHAEGGHAWLDLDDKYMDEHFTNDHISFLVGVDYTFNNNLYLVLEYFQEGTGKTSPEEDSVNDRLPLPNQESISIFAGAKYTFTPWLTWGHEQDISISVSALIPVGDEKSAVTHSEPTAFGHIQINF